VSGAKKPIVVDASALVAILLDEDESIPFSRFLLEVGGAQLSPVGYWEAATRMRRLRGPQGQHDLERLLKRFDISIAAAGESTARLASEAEAEYGKRTPAALNLGDCFAYALAKEIDAPLLFKGEDFTQTDIRRALPA
jgi:ribonuclease VapC